MNDNTKDSAGLVVIMAALLAGIIYICNTVITTHAIDNGMSQTEHGWQRLPLVVEKR